MLKILKGVVIGAFTARFMIEVPRTSAFSVNTIAFAFLIIILFFCLFEVLEGILELAENDSHTRS